MDIVKVVILIFVLPAETVIAAISAETAAQIGATVIPGTTALETFLHLSLALTLEEGNQALTANVISAKTLDVGSIAAETGMTAIIAAMDAGEMTATAAIADVDTTSAADLTLAI